MAEILFWTAIGLVLFTYGGYSLVILLLSRVIYNPIRHGDRLPSVTLLITAYNEEKNIGRNTRRLRERGNGHSRR